MSSPPSLASFLGRRQRLRIDRLTARGAFLHLDADLPLASLARAEVPEGVTEGQEIEAFVHLDGEGRPVATTTMPNLLLGEVAFLTVTDVVAFGAFVDWGLPKELLVPKGMETRELRVGDRHPFALVLDDTDRLAATMQIAERLRAPVAHAVGTWVEGEAWRNEPEIGLFVIVDKTCVGLVPRDEPHRVSRGDRVRARITRVHADGKFELSLRAAAHEALADDAAIVRDVLTREPTLRIGDGSSPREIRAWFGLSKKAFKRAVGRLLKDGHAKLGEDGSVVLVA